MSNSDGWTDRLTEREEMSGEQMDRQREKRVDKLTDVWTICMINGDGWTDRGTNSGADKRMYGQRGGRTNGQTMRN